MSKTRYKSAGVGRGRAWSPRFANFKYPESVLNLSSNNMSLFFHLLFKPLYLSLGLSVFPPLFFWRRALQRGSKGLDFKHRGHFFLFFSLFFFLRKFSYSIFLLNKLTWTKPSIGLSNSLVNNC